MKKATFLLILLSCVLFAQAQSLNIASYNIRNANPGDSINGNGWKERCLAICNIIDYYDFDIMGAQEVKFRQLNDILDNQKQYSYLGVGRDDGKTQGEYAPIFYKKEKFEIIKSGNFWMAEDTSFPNKGWDAALPRICTYGKLKDKNTGYEFWVFNLHMDHVGEVARKESSKLIISKIKELCRKEAVILMGDFNFDQTGENYTILNSSGILKDSYEMAANPYAPNGTFNAFNIQTKTDSRIDHIFVSSAFTVKKYGILTEIYWNDGEARLPSDHYPVCIKLKYEK